jgi:hypothetical protein
MLSLKSNITGSYLKQGKKPRVFVRIPDAGLYLGTETSGDFTDSIADFDTISQSIDKYGGMSEVSSFGVRNLQLGDRVTLCTEGDLSPQREGTFDGSGRIYAESPVYLSTRNATVGTNFASPAIVVGRSYSGGQYQVLRGYLQFALPTGITSCEEATLELVGMNITTYQAFTLRLVRGNWTALASTTGIFNDFYNWTGSGAYGITNYLETWTTAEYAAGTTKLRFNTAGKNLMVSQTGNVVRFMLLSSLDVLNSAAPSTTEYVQFEAASARLKLRYNTKTLDNQVASVYLAYDPVPAAYTDMQLLWTGVVDDYVINNKYIDLKLKQNDHKKNVMIPTKTITIEDFPSCPDENLNKPYPIPFGAADSSAVGETKLGIAREYSGVALNQLSGVRQYFPSPIVKNGDADLNVPMEILTSRQTMYDFIDGFPAVYIKGIKAFARLWANIGSDLGTTYQYVKAYPKERWTASSNTGSKLKELCFGYAVSIIPTYVFDYDGATTPEDSYDDTGGTAAIPVLGDSFAIGFPAIGSGGDIEKAEIVFQLKDNPAGDSYIKVVLYNNPTDYLDLTDPAQYVELTDGVTSQSGGIQHFTSVLAQFTDAGIVAGDFLHITTINGNEGRYKIASVESNSELHLSDTLTNATAQTYHITQKLTTPLHTEDIIKGTGQVVIDVTDHVGWDTEKYVVQFYYNNEVESGSFEISHTQMRYFISEVDKITEIYSDKEGHEFGSWIDTAGRSNSYNSGELIENPSYVIEALARDEMSLATSELDTTAFDTSGTELASWLFSFQINERDIARSILHNLYRQCRSKGLWDEQDRLSIVTFDSGAYFPTSGTDVPSGLDIFDTTGSPVSDAVTTNPIFDISIERVGLDEVKNDFVLKYKKNYASNDYLGTLYMTNGLGTAGSVATNMTEAYLENSQTLTVLKTYTSDSYTKYGTTNTLEFEADCIRDEATANKLLQYLIERMWKRRYIVTVTTKFNAIGLELGDFVNIRDDRINDLFGETTAALKKWEIIRKQVDLNNMKITFTTIEVD